jgi:YVTN family beta-propeller protein
MRTRVIAALSVAIAISCTATGLHAADPIYSKVGEIAIGGAGAFDYLNVDSGAGRLYVTHGTEVVVIDTMTNAIVGRIADTPGVHGIAIAPGGRGFTSNGREDKVSIVDLKTLKTIAKVDTGANPDAILYEPKHREIYALNHTGHSATVINAASGSVVATIPLAGDAESAQADPALNRVFVNIEDKNSVDVIDITTHKVVATWPVAPAEEPTGMAIDLERHLLFVGGGPNTVMIDAKTGKVLASAPICRGTDATWFDAKKKLVFSACGDGHIAVMKEEGGKALTAVETIDTVRGARTMALDAATHRIYTASSKFPPVDPNAPPQAGRGRGPAPIPDSFHVLVFGRKN